MKAGILAGCDDGNLPPSELLDRIVVELDDVN